MMGGYGIRNTGSELRRGYKNGLLIGAMAQFCLSTSPQYGLFSRLQMPRFSAPAKQNRYNKTASFFSSKNWSFAMIRCFALMNAPYLELYLLYKT
jgi:hypothetical protein